MGRIELIIAGRGGQGILLAGYILGLTLVRKGYHVVQSEAYSAETRGGDSRSELLVAKSADDIDYIRVRNADVAVYMYKEQARKYGAKASGRGIVVGDSTYLSEVELPQGRAKILMPFSEIAAGLGSIRVANMVMLGALTRILGYFTLRDLLSTIGMSVKPGWIELNKKAAKRGYEEAEPYEGLAEKLGLTL